MGAMDQKGAKICSQPREEIQWDSGAHCGHSASHLAAGTDGGHQTPSGSGRGDWYLKDCHHSQLPQDPQYRNTCKIQYEFHLKLNITESNLICVSWLFLWGYFPTRVFSGCSKTLSYAFCFYTYLMHDLNIHSNWFVAITDAAEHEFLQ